MKAEQALLGKIFLILFFAIFLQSFYKGLVTTPTEGDSLDYHIPYAKAFLKGVIFEPYKIETRNPYLRFYPANAEAVLSLFIFSGVPLGLFNVLAIGILFIVCIKLGLTFKLNPHLAIMFAVSVCTMDSILRWVDTQIIDIWLLLFFLISLLFLERLKSSAKSFLRTGTALGVLIGVKFSAPFIAIGLVLVYLKKIMDNITPKNIVLLLIPIILFGGVWYARNQLVAGNLFYPVPFFSLPGVRPLIFGPSVFTVFSGSLFGFLGTLNAFISEFMIWSIMIPLTVGFYVRDLKTGRLNLNSLPVRLISIGFLALLVAFNLPSALDTNIMVSSFRYFYAAVVPFILFSFIYWEKKGYSMPLLVCLLTNIAFVGFPLGFYPKLLIIAVPISVYVYFNGYDVFVSRIKKV